MPRYRRTNIDGKSLYKTETRKTAAALLPGTLAFINSSDLFAQAVVATPASTRLYVIGCAEHEGLGILDAVPQGHSAIGGYLEEGREFAVRMGAGTYRKDQPVTLNASGQVIAIPAGAGTYPVLGYVQENDPVTLTAADFIRIRAKSAPAIVVS